MNQSHANPYPITKQSFRTPTLERVDSKSGRLYKLPDGRLVPGVTTILECIAKPALLFWAAFVPLTRRAQFLRIFTL